MKTNYKKGIFISLFLLLSLSMATSLPTAEYKISGHIEDLSHNPLSGVKIFFSHNLGAVLTDENGLTPINGSI